MINKRSLELKYVDSPEEEYGAIDANGDGLRRSDIVEYINSLPYAIAKGAVGGHWQIIPLIIKTLVNVLRVASIIAPDKGVLHVGEDGAERRQTYAELLQSAKAVLGGLRDSGLRPGDQVVLQVDDSPSFLSAFWGSLLGGFVPVPLPIPGGFPISEGMDRITRVCSILERPFIVTDQEMENYKVLGDIEIKQVDELLEHAPARGYHRAKPEDTAILVFSSGSTGDPKGVMLSHRNILSALEAGSFSFIDVGSGDYRPIIGFIFHVIKRMIWKDKKAGFLRRAISSLSESSVGNFITRTKPGRTILDTLLILSGCKVAPLVALSFDDICLANWMPYSHVLGLIGFHLGPTGNGLPQITISTKTFVQNPALFLKLIEKYRVTYVPCPNFACQWLTTQVSDEDIEGLDLSCIKMLGNGSEPISPSVTRSFIDKFSKYGLDPKAMCMSYGMSEATVEITFPHLYEEAIFYRVDKNLFFKDKLISPTTIEEDSIEIADVGAPIQCMMVRIVDDDDRLLHENMVGHIQVKGPTVSKGYYNYPDANENLFCDGWIRTGDMGFMMNGRVAITGRQKDIIFVHGQNLYAHDIEEYIKRVPGMAYREFAIAGLRHYESDSEKIILFIRTTESRDAIAGLLSRVNNDLVANMGITIDFIVTVDEIPRTPSAKVKRFKLREEFENDEFTNVISLDDVTALVHESIEGDEGELSEVEEGLINIWKDVTGVEVIGRFDNFFDLGGNSLKATKVASRIQEEFAVDIPIRSLFEHQNIESLASIIDSMIAVGAARRFPPIVALESMDYYEVSHAQKRLWYLDKVIPNSPFYNIPAAVLIEKSQVDIDILKRSIHAVVDRHESLRTRFDTIDGKPVQIIADTIEADIKEIDISNEKSQEKRLQHIVDDEKLKPFNIQAGPLFRVRIVKISDYSHAIIIIMHHIISDFWSMGLLLQEVLGNYFTLLNNNPSPFPELRIQYKEFAHWQNRLIEGEGIGDQEEYWLQNLQGELPLLDLPTDRPRPAIQTQRGETHRMVIDIDSANKIKEFARDQDVTPFMLTLAIFKVLLHKLSGQDDIIIGSPIANRNNANIEPLIGFFVNVLPMRSDFSDNPIFSDLLLQIKRTALGAYANQDYPFDKLVEILNPVRDMSRSPVFDVVYEYREGLDVFFAGLDSDEISVKNITGDDPMAKFDIFVTINDISEEMIMQFEYNADLFNRPTIERIMGFFLNLIREIPKSHNRPISEIDMLCPKERADILFKFNNTARDFPKDKCVHELFEEQVNIFPDKDALVFGDDSISYSQLNKMSNRIACRLREHGVGRGEYVAIIVERSFDMIAGVLGILKAGGAYVPIESEYPLSRTKYMLDEIQAPVVIIHEQFLDTLPEYDGYVMCLESFWKEGETIESADLNNINKPDDVAYVIYTSGSTGKPKGVMVPHVGISRLVKNTNFADITPEDRFLQIATFAFDAATLEFWGPLLNGGTLFLARGSDVTSPDGLADLLLSNDISIIFLTVVLYNQLIDLRPDAISKLRRLLVGGEALSVSHIRKGLGFVLPGVISNGYGPTENTTFSCHYPVKSVPEGANSIPIGYPIANSRVYILDKYLKPVPIGVRGEVFLGGYGLAKGYLNDSEKTANSFIKNPIMDVDDPILYRTGDIGRWLPDGSVDFMGRIDHQVKVRGHRIELGEIESVMREHGNIKDCVVVVNELEGGNKAIVAYHVSEDDVPIDELRSFMRDSLPDYMLPNLFMRLDELPLNQNGKVDRSALPEPHGMRPEMSTDFVAPSDEIQSIIVKTWEDVLGIEGIGVCDNFFDLGGDSIISLQVVSRLNQRGFLLQPKDILLYQTIAELSTIVEIAKGVEAEQGPVVGTAPPTPIQRWFFDQGLANENHYNQALTFKSSFPIDENALRVSLQAIVDHHDVLRARFVDGMLEYRPLGEDAFLVVREIEDEADLGVEAWSLQGSYNLADGPLFGAGLYRKGDEDYLLLAAHHLVTDGVSWRIILEDLLSCYMTASKDGNIMLPAKTTSFMEWSNKLQEYAVSILSQEEADYWEVILSKIRQRFRIDHDLGPDDVGSSECVSVELSRENTGSLLKDAHRAYNTNMNDLLLTALMKTLQGWLGRDDVAFDLEAHGREEVIEGVDISRTVGWFTSMYPVLFQSDRDLDLSSRIKYVKEVLHNIPYRGFNYCVFKYMLGKGWPLNTGLSFNYLGQALLPESYDAISLIEHEVPGTIADENIRPNLIDVNCIVVEDQLRINFSYSRNRYNKRTIEELADLYKRELSAVILHCLDPESFDITPSDFDLVKLDQGELDDLAAFE
ncbi:MAG: amino acid adenylation domain-containing protein [Spirochaetota bacterium]|nr:amino acid adenylation domain-containing protein [Spirochaetota bacterium]